MDSSSSLSHLQSLPSLLHLSVAWHRSLPPAFCSSIYPCVTPYRSPSTLSLRFLWAAVSAGWIIASEAADSCWFFFSLHCTSGSRWISWPDATRPCAARKTSQSRIQQRKEALMEEIVLWWRMNKAHCHNSSHSLSILTSNFLRKRLRGHNSSEWGQFNVLTLDTY